MAGTPWTYHQSTGGDLSQVSSSNNGNAVESATVDGVLWARARGSKPIKGDLWDYRMSGTDEDMLRNEVNIDPAYVDDEIVAVLAAFGVTP